MKILEYALIGAAVPSLIILFLVYGLSFLNRFPENKVRFAFWILLGLLFGAFIGSLNGCAEQPFPNEIQNKTHEIKCWDHIIHGVNEPMPPITYYVSALGPVWLFRQADGTMLVYHDLKGNIQFIRLMDYEGNTYNECGVN